MKQRNLKYQIMISAIGLIAAWVFISCEQEFYKDEQYRKEIYIVSSDDNIFGQEFGYGGSLGYVSIYAGGATSIEHDVTVDLMRDENILGEYNQRLYGESFEKYAQELPQKAYTIENMSVTLKPSENKPYSLMPIRVNIDELAPDVKYFIPLKIASVSDYMISKNRGDVLLQIFMKNEYATTKTKTYYSMNGTSQKGKEEGSDWHFAGTEEAQSINSTKIVTPIGMNSIRILPSSTSSEDALVLRKKGISVTVNPDEWINIPVIGDDGLETGEFVKMQKVTVASWIGDKDALSVKVMEDEPSYYDPVKKVFTLHYRYKFSDSSDWYKMKEILTVMNTIIVNKE